MENQIVVVRKAQGFSLIELVVVLLVISIIAIIAVPRWTTSPKLDAQLQQVLSDLRYAQQLAITHGQRFRVNFTSNSYSITNWEGTTPVLNPSTGASIVTLSEGTTFSSLTNLPNNLIIFDGLGTPFISRAPNIRLSTDATITLTANGVSRSIVIAPQTGWMVAQ